MRGTLLYKPILMAALFLFWGCQPSGSGDRAATDSGATVSAAKTAQFQIHLTDAPLDAKSVFVNIDHIEILMSKGGKEGRVILAENFGPVDLLTLRNGVLLPMANIEVPVGVSAHQIRLVLKEEGHYVVKNDNSICQMKTPSAQKTGVKVLLTSPVTFEAKKNYSMVVDFDAEKSVVTQGNGGCLLKPVLKITSLLKSDWKDDDDNDLDDVKDPEDQPSAPEEMIDDPPTNDLGDGDGFDIYDPSTWPPGVTEEDLLIYF